MIEQAQSRARLARGGDLIVEAQQLRRLLSETQLRLAEVRAENSVLRGKLTEQEAKLNKLKNDYEGRMAGFPGVRRIIRITSEQTGVSELDIISQRRQLKFTLARHVAMYLARSETLRSYPAIARAFGGRDQAGIQYGCRRIEKRLEVDEDLADLIHGIRLRLKEETNGQA